MNSDIELMMKIYNTYDVDWMGDEIRNINDLTKHHIIKKENGGLNDISNYALLTRNSHELLHYLEDNYFREYVYLNTMFKELNLTLEPPTLEYYEKVRMVMRRVKKSIKNKNRKRSKRRIK